MDEQIKLIIANDNSSELQEQKKELAKAGINVVATASDGDELDTLLSNTDTNVVLLDAILSKQDGFAILEKYKNSQIKFIMLTALSSVTFIQKAVNLVEEFTKPSKDEEIKPKEDKIDNIYGDNNEK